MASVFRDGSSLRKARAPQIEAPPAPVPVAAPPVATPPTGVATQTNDADRAPRVALHTQGEGRGSETTTDVRGPTNEDHGPATESVRDSEVNLTPADTSSVETSTNEPPSVAPVEAAPAPTPPAPVQAAAPPVVAAPQAVVPVAAPAAKPEAAAPVAAHATDVEPPPPQLPPPPQPPAPPPPRPAAVQPPRPPPSNRPPPPLLQSRLLTSPAALPTAAQPRPGLLQPPKVTKYEKTFEFGARRANSILIGKGPFPPNVRSVFIPENALQPVHARLVAGARGNYYLYDVTTSGLLANRLLSMVRDGQDVELAPGVFLRFQIVELDNLDALFGSSFGSSSDDDGAATLRRPDAVHVPPAPLAARADADGPDQWAPTSAAPGADFFGSAALTTSGRSPRHTTPDEGVASHRLGAQAQAAQNAPPPNPAPQLPANQQAAPPRGAAPKEEEEPLIDWAKWWPKLRVPAMIAAGLIALVAVSILAWRAWSTPSSPEESKPAKAQAAQEVTFEPSCVPITAELTRQHFGGQTDITHLRRVKKTTAKAKCETTPPQNDDGSWNLTGCQICPLP